MTETATTYTRARDQLAALCDAVTGNREAIIIRRRGKEDVALIAASELRSLQETAHLAASPANARRLQRALRDAKAGRRMTRMSPPQLRAWAEAAAKGRKRARRKA
ncbi:MAG: type II toxin-antitoxin system Phd/YefM family antitoxin [Betaproteobacteria bacterium]|nr:type II toxin-antitoxin system Phd/YefM family antitoxin [Betaproteobacteria bacterium]